MYLGCPRILVVCRDTIFGARILYSHEITVWYTYNYRNDRVEIWYVPGLRTVWHLQ